MHEVLSLQFGSGFEHQFPHLYSQVGVGDTVVVDVQRDAVVLVVVVEVVGLLVEDGVVLEELLVVLEEDVVVVLVLVDVELVLEVLVVGG